MSSWGRPTAVSRRTWIGVPSVLGFSYSASGGVGSSPSQSFTPNSGLFSNELLDYPVTKCSTGSDTSCSYSFESLNQNWKANVHPQPSPPVTDSDRGFVSINLRQHGLS